MPIFLPVLVAMVAASIRPSQSAQSAEKPLKLVWSDEFNRAGAPSPKDWVFEHGFVRNAELQWYQPANATVVGDVLRIQAKQEAIPNPAFNPSSEDWKKSRRQADYTSACLETRGLHSWLYGRFEFRARFNPSLGMWPAIWFLGTTRTWPHCGEVDLLEYYQHTLLANACWANGVWSTAKTPIETFYSSNPGWSKHFHVWRMDWNRDWIKLYVDGRLENAIDLSKTVDADGYNPFHHPMYLLMNLAVGATGGDPSHTHFPADFEVDWARVYQ